MTADTDEEPKPARAVRAAPAFLVAAGCAVYLALEGGGYDIATRQRFALIVWSALAVGFATGFLPRGRPSRALALPAIAALALVGWMLLSLTWTESVERTWTELARLVGYLGVMGLAVAGLHRGNFRAAAAGVSVAVFAVVGIAVASRLYPNLFPGAGEVARTFEADRLDFPLDYWNAVGAWAAMALAIGLAWSAHARYAATRALSLAALPLVGACAYLTFSRGALVGAAVAVAATIALSRNRWTALANAGVGAGGVLVAVLSIRAHPEIENATGGGGGGAVTAAILAAAALCAVGALVTFTLRVDRLRLPRRLMRYAVPAAAVVVLAGVAIGARGPIATGWDEFRQSDYRGRVGSGAERLTSVGGNRANLWKSALAATEADPLKGTGPGTYELWWSREARDPEYVRNAHSLYLESFAEMGVPGGVILLVFLAGSLAAALRARRGRLEPSALAASVALSAAFCVFLVNSAVDWMWQVPAVAAVALGGIAAAAAAASTPFARGERRGMLGRPGVRPAIVLAAVAAAAVQVPGLQATEKIRASDAATRAGDLGRARSLAETAVDAMPWASSPYERLALVEESIGDLAAARRAAEQAVDKSPTDWRYPLLLARIEAEQGDLTAARRTFQHGRNLRPLSPSYSLHSTFGREIFTEAQLKRIRRREDETR